MISVLIADDQDLIRKGLRMLLEAEPDLRVAGEAGDGSQALAQARRLDPDVILMDVRMPGLDGIQATTQLAQGGSRAKILMLTTFNLDEYVYHAMKAGASGFLLKDATREQLTGAIRAVCGRGAAARAGHHPPPDRSICQGPAPGTPAGSAAGGLSERERAVVSPLGGGGCRTARSRPGSAVQPGYHQKPTSPASSPDIRLRFRVQIDVYGPRKHGKSITQIGTTGCCSCQLSPT